MTGAVASYYGKRSSSVLFLSFSVLFCCVVLASQVTARKEIVVDSSTLFDIKIFDVACYTHTAQAYVGQNVTLTGSDAVIQIGFWSQLATAGDRAIYKASPNEGALGFLLNWQPPNQGTYQSSWLSEDSNGCYWGAVVDDIASTGVQIAPAGSNACSWSLC